MNGLETHTAPHPFTSFGREFYEVHHADILSLSFNLSSAAQTVSTGLMIGGLPFGDNENPLLRSRISDLERQRVSFTDRL